MSVAGAQDYADLFFGRIAVKNGLATQAQVDDALKAQEADGQVPGGTGRRSLGEILIEKGYLSHSQVDSILAAQARSEVMLAHTLFGKIAVKNNLVTEDQLLECLSEQKAEGYKRPIGRILTDKGYITSRQLEALLSAQKRVRKR